MTDLHLLRARAQCKRCSAHVWPEEGTICCKGGKAFLGPEYNPPIDEDYLELLNLPHFSHDSRLLNAALAMGTQGVYPSRAMGGLGLHVGGIHICVLGVYDSRPDLVAAVRSPDLPANVQALLWGRALHH